MPTLGVLICFATIYLLLLFYDYLKCIIECITECVIIKVIWNSCCRMSLLARSQGNTVQLSQ